MEGHRNNATAAAFATLEAQIAHDPDYAWAWHCNLAMPIMDAIGCTNEQANKAAAHVMAFLWDCDASSHPLYPYRKHTAEGE